MSKSRPRYDETHKNVEAVYHRPDRGMNIQERVVEAVYGPFDPPHDFTKPPPLFTPAILADLERKLAAMVDERLASLERRIDLLYRYTVGDRAGRHMLVPNMNQRGEEFPE